MATRDEEAPTGAGGLHPTASAFRKMSVVNQDLPQLLHEAKDATDVEKSMTILQAFKTYPRAVIFSMILSTGTFIFLKWSGRLLKGRILEKFSDAQSSNLLCISDLTSPKINLSFG
jgi:hypothetical protein